MLTSEAELAEFRDPFAFHTWDDYRRVDFAEAIDLLARGRIPTEALITGSAPLDQAEAMFQTLTARNNTHVKVLLAPQIASRRWRRQRRLSALSRLFVLLATRC
jgi:hypothetical protein